MKELFRKELLKVLGGDDPLPPEEPEDPNAPVGGGLKRWRTPL